MFVLIMLILGCWNRVPIEPSAKPESGPCPTAELAIQVDEDTVRVVGYYSCCLEGGCNVVWLPDHAKMMEYPETSLLTP